MLNSSDIPRGKTNCLSQRTLGQDPNIPFKNLARIVCNPLEERINL